jgi:hypothetical protein
MINKKLKTEMTPVHTADKAELLVERKTEGLILATEEKRK